MQIICEIGQCVWNFDHKCGRHYVLVINQQGQCKYCRPPVDAEEKEFVRSLIENVDESEEN